MKSFFEYLKNMFVWFGSFFSEETGKGSMKRLIMFLVTSAFVRVYLLKGSKEAGAMMDVPEIWALLLAAFVGINVASNYFQNKKSEEPK